MGKGKHFSGCVYNYPECPCIKCAKDCEADKNGWLCCERHKRVCDGTPCPDMVEEEEGEIDV